MTVVLETLNACMKPTLNSTVLGPETNPETNQIALHNIFDLLVKILSMKPTLNSTVLGPETNLNEWEIYYSDKLVLQLLNILTNKSKML